MDNLRLLHLSYDGPIPRALVNQAIEDDLAAMRSRRRNSVKVRLKAWKPEGIIDRMAEVMRRFNGQRPCYRGDLAQAGFSTKEIDRHAEDARALAARRIADDPNAARPIEIPVTQLLAHVAAMKRQGAAS